MTHVALPGPNRMARYLTTADVAELCRTSAETVRYWRYVGKGPASFKVGRKVLYDVEDVEAWIAEQRAAEQPA
jgi:predicted DNA-binding transcriptional regulator AlpA